jgi:hypothetical protein
LPPCSRPWAFVPRNVDLCDIHHYTSPHFYGKLSSRTGRGSVCFSLEALAGRA